MPKNIENLEISIFSTFENVRNPKCLKRGGLLARGTVYLRGGTVYLRGGTVYLRGNALILRKSSECSVFVGAMVGGRSVSVDGDVAVHRLQGIYNYLRHRRLMCGRIL